MPLNPSTVLISKFLIVLRYEYITQAIIFIPLITVYGIKGDIGIAFAIYSILIFFTLPILPLIASSILSILIMKFTPFVKNKDSYKIFSGFIGIALMLGTSLIFRAINKVTPEQIESSIINFHNSSIGLIKLIFPTIDIANLSLINSTNYIGILNILTYLIINILALLLFMFIGHNLYLKGVIGLSEVNTKNKNRLKVEYEKKIISNSKIMSLVKKEFKILMRTPDYLMSCIVPIVLYPVFILILLLGSSLNEVTPFLKFNIVAPYIVLFGFCFVLFQNGANATASTSISREGKEINILKFMPVDFKEIIMSKLLTSVLLGMISVCILSAIFTFLQVHLITVALFLLSSLQAIVFSTQLGILIDLSNPKVNWQNEQQAIRQNFNPIFNMFLCSILSGTLGFYLFKMYLSTINYFLILSAIFVLLNVFVYKRLIKVCEKKIMNLEL